MRFSCDIIYVYNVLSNLEIYRYILVYGIYLYWVSDVNYCDNLHPVLSFIALAL